MKLKLYMKLPQKIYLPRDEEATATLLRNQHSGRPADSKRINGPSWPWLYSELGLTIVA